jgi:hypothetical protein
MDRFTLRLSDGMVFHVEPYVAVGRRQWDGELRSRAAHTIRGSARDAAIPLSEAANPEAFELQDNETANSPHSLNFMFHVEHRPLNLSIPEASRG